MSIFVSCYSTVYVLSQILIVILILSYLTQVASFKTGDDISVVGDGFMSAMFDVANTVVLEHGVSFTRLLCHTSVPTLDNILVLGCEVFDVSSPEVLVHQHATW